MVEEKFEHIETLISNKFQEDVAESSEVEENSNCTECGKNTTSLEKLRNDMAKTQAEKFLIMSKSEIKIKELEKKLKNKSEIVQVVKPISKEVNTLCKKCNVKKVRPAKQSPKIVKETKVQGKCNPGKNLIALNAKQILVLRRI